MRFIDSPHGRATWLSILLCGSNSLSCSVETTRLHAGERVDATGNPSSAGSATGGGGGMSASVSDDPPLVLEVGSSPDIVPEGNGAAETCDGLDNDDNGIVDDVDAGGDGICDCLNIATVGRIGPWSNGGNVFAAWLAARSPLGAVALADAPLTPELLAPFQVIITLHVATVAATSEIGPHHAFSEPEVAALRDWVQAGGGLMTTLGYTGSEADEVVNVNRLLAPLAMGYSTTLTSLDGPVPHWAAHPVTEGLLNIRTDNGAEPQGGTLLAQDGMNRQALSVGEAGQGRVAVWGDEWITYDSEWADVEGQQVERFWLNLFRWLSPPRQCQVPTPARVK